MLLMALVPTIPQPVTQNSVFQGKPKAALTERLKRLNDFSTHVCSTACLPLLDLSQGSSTSDVIGKVTYIVMADVVMTPYSYGPARRT